MRIEELTRKLIIGVPTLFSNPEHKGREELWKNWIECENTWVPLLRERGFKIIYLVSNEYLDKEYEYKDPFLFIRCKDDVTGLLQKVNLGPFKYILNETHYKYYFKIDPDCFVHPERFINMLLDNFSKFDVDYLGTHFLRPDEYIDPTVSNQVEIYDYNFASGSAILFSRYAMEIILKEFKIEDIGEHEDVLAARLLLKNNIPMVHDTRIMYDSPFRVLMPLSGGRPHPFIGESNSHLALQHYCNGNMEKIKNMLGL